MGNVHRSIGGAAIMALFILFICLLWVDDTVLILRLIITDIILIVFSAIVDWCEKSEK